MVPLRHIVRDHAKAGATHTLMNLYGFLDDGLFLTKSGGVGVAYALRGVDYECLDDAKRAETVERWARACRVLTEGFCLYQYLVKRHAALTFDTSHPNPVVAHALRERHVSLNARRDHLFTFEQYAVILYDLTLIGGNGKQPSRQAVRHPLFALRTQLSGVATLHLLDDELSHACQTLVERSDTWALQLRDVLAPTRLDRAATLRFLRQLVHVDASES
jgi:type IV secretory pathway VirB4 component